MLVLPSNVITWGLASDRNGNQDDQLPGLIEALQSPGFVHTRLCRMVRRCQPATNRLEIADKRHVGDDEKGCEPHVLITEVNGNWGGLSTEIAERTITWGDKIVQWKTEGCTEESVRSYLDSGACHGVITTQHHVWEHPKVHSAPLGIRRKNVSILHGLLHSKESTCTSKDWLMINDSGWRHRAEITKWLLKAFPGVKNTYPTKKNFQADEYPKYYEQMTCSRYVLCPSGMGWDCYRIWEVLAMGTIPVMEFSAGFHHALGDLPVLWVDHFSELTQELLEQKFVQLSTGKYNYQRLTSKWCLDSFNAMLGTKGLEVTQAVSSEAVQAAPEQAPVSQESLAQSEQHGLSRDAAPTNAPNNAPTDAPTNAVEPKRVNSTALGLQLQGLGPLHPSPNPNPNGVAVKEQQQQQTCDQHATKVIHDATKVHAVGTPVMHLPSHQAKIGYAPFFTKCGSTSAVDMMEAILGKDKVMPEPQGSQLEGYTFVSFVRHPLERALAGYHQLEVFYRMG